MKRVHSRKVARLVLLILLCLLCDTQGQDFLDFNPRKVGDKLQRDRVNKLKLSASVSNIKNKERKLFIRSECDVNTGTVDGFTFMENIADFAATTTSLDCSNTFLDNAPGGFSIPTEIGLLTKLTKLALPFVRGVGQIPSELSQLRGQLSHLDLSNNQFTGKVKRFLGTFTKLTSLSTENNLFTGPIPDNFGRLINLRFLNLKQNALTGIVDTTLIGDLQQLEVLQLSLNLLGGPVPPSLGRLNKLKILDLSNNAFSGNVPATLSSILTLQEVYLNSNNLIGPWPSFVSILSTQQTLNKVDLGDNNFELFCDNLFFQEYDEIKLKTEIINPESLICSQVNTYGEAELNPEVLRFVAEAPGTHGTILGTISVAARSLEIEWTFDKSRDIIIDDPGLFTLQEIENTGFDFVGVYRIVDEPLFLRDCKPFLNTRIEGDQVTPQRGYSLAFEVTFKSNVDNKRVCFLEQHLNTISNGQVYTLEMLQLRPATDYSINVRPLYVYFPIETGEFSRLTFGIKSATLKIKTNDDVPESAPLNFVSTAATFSEITLSWDEPDSATSNGEILQYLIEHCEVSAGPCTFVADPTTTDKRQVVIKNLLPDREYFFTIRSKTGAAEYSNIFASYTSTTCPENMKREGSDAVGCIAIRNNIQIGPKQSINCEVVIGEDVLDINACDADGISIRDLELKKGFWRPNVDQYEEIKKCRIAGFCRKENNITIDAGRRLSDNETLVEPESRQCTEHHRGTYCYSCDDGYALSLLNGCVECDSKSKGEQLTNFYLFNAFIFGVCMLCVVFVILRTRKDSILKKYSCASRFKTYLVFMSAVWHLMTTKLRIFESFLQVLFGFKFILYVGSQSSLASLALEAIANLNLGLIAYAFNFNCAVVLNHYTTLLIYTASPILLMVLTWLAYCWFVSKTKSRKVEMQQESFNMFFIISFLVYPGASKVIFDTFYCEDFETVSEESEYIFKSALRSDYRISCQSSPERIGWLSYACLMVLVYPIGILVVYLYFLRKFNRSTGEEHQKYAYLVTELIQPYKREKFWFEAYELVRKLLQTSFLSFAVSFGNTDFIQYFPTVVALNMSVIALALLIYLNPYQKQSDFIFAIISLLWLVFASQLNVWFDSRDCDLECRERKIGDALYYIVISNAILMVLLILCDLCLDRTSYVRKKSDAVQVSDALTKQDITANVEETL